MLTVKCLEMRKNSGKQTEVASKRARLKRLSDKGNSLGSEGKILMDFSQKLLNQKSCFLLLLLHCPPSFTDKAKPKFHLKMNCRLLYMKQENITRIKGR